MKGGLIANKSLQKRCFNVSDRELNRLKYSIRSKMKILQMTTENRFFNYEPPQMYYDKVAKEVRIRPREAKKRKKIINNIDEALQIKEELLKEVEIDEENSEILNDDSEQKVAAAMKNYNDKLQNEYEIDRSNFYAFSHDFMRVDVGIMI